MAYFDRGGERQMPMRRDPDRLPDENVPVDREPEFQPPIFPPPTLPPQPRPLPGTPAGPLPQMPIPGMNTGRGGVRRQRPEAVGGPTGLGGGTFATPQSPRSMVPFRTTEFPRARGVAPFSPGWGSIGGMGEGEDDDVRRYLQFGGRAVL